MGLFDKGGKNEGDVVRVGRLRNEGGEDYNMRVCGWRGLYYEGWYDL